MNNNKLIVIVETDQVQIEKIEKLIREVNRKADIVTTGNILDAYKLVRKRTVSLLITGLELNASHRNEYPGIRLIRQIRKHILYQFLPVIALSLSEDQKEHLYTDLNCVGYFTKPIDEIPFKNLVERMLSHEEMPDEENVFSVQRHNVRYVIRVKDLMYVESYGRALHIHMQDGSVFEISQKPIHYIIKEAKSKSLIRCARGTLVNMEYIFKVNIPFRYILLDNDEDIKIGGSYVNKVKEAWKPDKKRTKINGKKIEKYWECS